MNTPGTGTRRLVILGAGTFAREVLWTVQRAAPDAATIGFLDDDVGKHGKTVDGLSVLGPVEWLAGQGSEKPEAVLAVGTPSLRRSIAERAVSAGAGLATIIDPGSFVHPDAELGPGCLVMAGAVISVGARVGRGGLLNFGATAGHDTVLGDYCVLDPGSRIGGGAVLGSEAEVGTNGVVLPGRAVGERAKVGAGSVALVDVPPDATAFGVPAKIMRTGRRK